MSFTIRVICLVALALAPITAHAQSAEERLAAASALFDAAKYAEAAQKLDSFLGDNPAHARAGAAALALGRCRNELKQYPLAIAAYEKAVGSKDAAVLIPARLGLGEAAINGRDFERATSALELSVKDPLKPEQAAIAWYWLAQADFQLGRFAASQTAYERVTTDYGSSDFVDDAFYGAGLAALRQGKTDDASRRFKEVVARFPKSEDRPQALLLLAQIDLQAKRYKDARAGFESTLKDYPSRKELAVPAEDGLIQSLLALADYEAAIPRLESAIVRLPATDPQRFRAQLGLGHCRYRRKEYDKALGPYIEASRSPEDTVAFDGFYWAANASLALNKPAEAADQFKRAVTRAPHHELAPRAQIKVGDALAAAHQTEAAAAAYHVVLEKYAQSSQVADARKALAELADAIDNPQQLAATLKTLDPADRAPGMLRLGRIYLNGKKYAEAVNVLSGLLNFGRPDATGAEASYLLGLAEEGLGKPDLAVTAFAQSVRAVPDALWATDAQGRLAWLYLEIKQPDNAEKAAAAVLAAKPKPDAEQQARLAMIQAQLDQRKWDAAIEGTKLLMAGNPPPETVAAVVFTQAWIAEKRDKPEESLPLWERLSAEFPMSPYAADALLRIGDARMKAEKYDESRERYAALLSVFPKSRLAPEARFKLGSSLYNLNRAADAAVEFDTVAGDKSAGDYGPESLYWAGVAMDKAGKKEEAIQRLSRLVAQYPMHARVTNAKIRLAALKALTGK